MRPTHLAAAVNLHFNEIRSGRMRPFCVCDGLIIKLRKMCALHVHFGTNASD